MCIHIFQSIDEMQKIVSMNEKRLHTHSFFQSLKSGKHVLFYVSSMNIDRKFCIYVIVRRVFAICVGQKVCMSDYCACLHAYLREKEWYFSRGRQDEDARGWTIGVYWIILDVLVVCSISIYSMYIGLYDWIPSKYSISTSDIMHGKMNTIPKRT